MNPDEEPRKVFGLSIDETLEWYVAYVTKDGILEKPDPQMGILSTLPKDTDHTKAGVRSILQTTLRYGLSKLHQGDEHFFDNIKGVGISTIGVVDTKKKLIENIARKHWDDRADFVDLFCKNAAPFFETPLGIHQIQVQNDSSARALAEYHYGAKDRPERLFYIAAGEGVNAAAVINGKLITGTGNSEVAHWMPQLHREDLDFNDSTLSGCSVHVRCYEGLCSRHRIRKEWGGPEERELWELPKGPIPSSRNRDIDPRELIAFYIGQMAYTAALVFNPTRIVLGGHLFWDRSGDE
jgi:predicted NBD/HSP70 family sugar kinase